MLLLYGNFTKSVSYVHIKTQKWKKKINDISVAPLCVCGAAWSCITEIFSDMIFYEKKTLMYTITDRQINCM